MQLGVASMDLWFLSMWIPVLLLLPLLLLWIKKKIQNKNLPPSPPKLPIIGNLHQMGSMPHQSFWKLSQKYGPVMHLQLGSVPNVVISSPETAREVLKVHDLDCCNRPCLAGSGRLTYNYLDISFSPYSDNWREMRKLCVLEVFSLKRVQSFRFVREEEVTLLINLISQSASSATPVNLTDEIYFSVASIVFRMAFGKSFRGSGLDHDAFHQLLNETATVVGVFSASDYFPYVGWIIDMLTGYHAKVEKVFQQLDTLFEQAISVHLNHERAKHKDGDIVDVMLEIEREQSESGAAWLSRDHIKAILMNMFFGGIDTSAVTTVWAMAELVRNPRVMTKAQDEIRNCVGNKERVTLEDIDQLEYLKMVIKETLRLHPVVPLLVVRESMSHVKINSYDIFPKTMIHVNAWGIGRDPKYWKNPEEFFPDRFIDNPIDFRGQHFEFLAFGSGRRSCPGMNMGLATVEIVLANLLYHFNWEPPEGMTKDDISMEEEVGVTLSKKTPLHLVPINYLKQPMEDNRS